MRILSLIPILLGFWFAACCEPGHRDAQPVVIDSLFQRSYGKDLDVYTAQQITNAQLADSAYFPIYTFAIKNSGSQDDNFTLSIRKTRFAGFVVGFDITKHVPAGATVLFQTPLIPRDSSATYYFPILVNPTDTNFTIDKAYYGLQASTPDSTRIRYIRPSVTITYGAIDNGPEACNTPASTQTIDINELPDR